MLARFQNWFNDRTGYRKVLDLYRHRILPNGPSWGATTGSCTFWIFVLELITGLALLTTYSPSATSAWASVFYIENQPGGSFLRGLHYFTSQALIISFALHTIRILLSASYRAPRELVWITCLLILPLLLALAVTGNPLTATQKGYSQIEVEANILGSSPGIGPAARQILIGGDQVGNLTLTHLNFLHIALLPLIVILLTIVHIHQLIKHAPSDKELTTDDTTMLHYWPHQTIRNTTVVSVVFAIIAFLGYTQGAPLEAPADPEIHYIPRPEWYFLFLFELRTYFPGELEIIATMVIPTVGLGFLLLLPFLDRFFSEKISKALHYFIVIGFVLSWTFLTFNSLNRDWNDQEYLASKHHEEELAERALQLASQGIPPEGAGVLLQNDPKTNGPKLFAQHCASCHSHSDADGKGIVSENPSAPNLYRFGSREWVAKVLDPEEWASDHMFGKTAFKDGDMSTGVTDDLEDEKALQQVIAALSAEASLPYQEIIDREETKAIEAGQSLILDDESCVSCHKFNEGGENGNGPDLTGYGSSAWMKAFISNPLHERFYPDTNDRMPSFASDPEHPELNLLDERSIKLISDWIRRDWYEPAETTEE